MKDPINQINLKEKLENYLDTACRAEAEGNKLEANRLLSLALRYDELSQSDINSSTGDIQQTRSENGNHQLKVKVRIQETDHEKHINNQ